MAVFVLDKNKKPLMPASEKRARLLLERGRAVVHKRFPFTIRLKDRIGGTLQPLHIKMDPGSRYTGMAVVRDGNTVDAVTGEIKTHVTVLALLQLNHRGHSISESLTARRAMRRRRRGNLRYRAARFDNRTKPKGWLAPSLQHRVDTIMSWVTKLQRLAPATVLSQELVRFDMQQMENPEISGVEYQQGVLAGFEVKEYLLLKWNHQCAYCDVSNVPLEVEHILAKTNGGSNRLSNLALACRPCNQAKGALSVEVFLKQQPERLRRILAQAKKPQKDAAAVNSTRWALLNALQATGLKVTTGSGGLTKFNRQRHAVPKSHALDAACVGHFDEIIRWHKPVLEITCRGRGSYQRTLLNKYGFSRGVLMRQKSIHRFQTGDMVKAVVTKGKKTGAYVGRVAVRTNGYFNISSQVGLIQGIRYQDCILIARNDGYGYQFQPKIAY